MSLIKQQLPLIISGRRSLTSLPPARPRGPSLVGTYLLLVSNFLPFLVRDDLVTFSLDRWTDERCW